MTILEAQAKAKVMMAWELLYESIVEAPKALPQDIGCAVRSALTELDEELIAAGWVENIHDDEA